VIPTHQRRRSLERVLDGLARQSCPIGLFTAVIVCDGCTDGTADMLRNSHYPFQLHVLEQSPAQGPAAARNRAVSAVGAPIVLFLDDDVIPHERLVAVHAAHHAEHSDVVVIGPLLGAAGRQHPWIRWEAETLNKQYREMEAGAWTPTPRQFYTGNASVRRQHVLDAGGFNPRLLRGEDVDLAFRLQRRGLRFLFEPEAGGVHIARRSFRSWVQAAHEYGRVELAMGPVWGARGLVDVKVIEFQRRHAVVRRAVGLGLGYPRAAPALVAAGGVLGRVAAAAGIWPVARGAYTAIFELAYWRGVEEALGVRGSAMAWVGRSRKTSV
jgi:GT2 family glycosyltransferase